MKETKSVIVSPERERAIFSNLNKKYAGMIISPGKLRIEQAIVNGKSTYTFPVTKDANSDTVTEEKLDRNDSFMVTDMGLFLMKRLSTKTGGEVLQTYPNPVAIPDDSTNFLAADLEVFYNGKLSMKEGQTVFIERFPTERFRVVPDAQQASGAFYAINASGAEATSSVLAAASKQLMIANSGRTKDAGMIPLTPQILLNGDKKNEITVTAPVHSTAKIANTVSNTTNYLVLLLYGFQITKK